MCTGFERESPESVLQRLVVGRWVTGQWVEWVSVRMGHLGRRSMYVDPCMDSWSLIECDVLFSAFRLLRVNKSLLAVGYCAVKSRLFAFLMRF